MRIAFVVPNLSGDFSALDIAVTVLASVVNASGRHKASIVDLTFHRQDWQSYLRDSLVGSGIEVIGMSLNALHMDYARQVGQYIKSFWPRLPIIVGGHHASTRWDEVRFEPWVSNVFIGDAEDTLIQYLDYPPGEPIRHVGRLRPDGSIPGLVRIAGFRENLDDLPLPDWTLWEDLDKYFYYLGGMLYVIGSRGCPHRCTFCLAPEIQDCVQGNYYRRRDPWAFADELHHLSLLHWRRGARFFQIFDPVFTLDPEWVQRFCDRYRGRWGFPFSVFARLDQLDEPRVMALAQANCKIIRVGIESGDDYIRNEVFKKNVTREQILDAVRLCKAHGIALTAYYILGGPGETHGTALRTLSLGRLVDAARSVFFVYKPFTVAGIDQVRQLGGSVLDAHADNIAFGVSIRPSANLSPFMVGVYQKIAYLLTFSKRLLRIVKRDKLGYFTQLARYIWRGRKDGLPWNYILAYFHVYSGKNVEE